MSIFFNCWRFTVNRLLLGFDCWKFSTAWNHLNSRPESMIKVEAFCDCNDTVEAIRSTKQNNKSVLVQADIAKIKQLVERKQVNTINWIPTQHQLADCLTKRGAATTAIEQTVVKGKFFA